MMLIKFHNWFRAFLRTPYFIWAYIRSKPVSLDVASSRLAICCECADLDLITRQCTHCWCFVRYKVQWEKEKCPLEKWQA